MKTVTPLSLRSTATAESPKGSVRFAVPGGGDNAGSTPLEPGAPPPPPSTVDVRTTLSIRFPPPASTNSSQSVESQQTRSTSPKGSRNLFHSSSLRSNLTREQRDRDPLFFYEIVQTLGVGSMGSVARVQKRTAIIGGSARRPFQQAVRRQKRSQKCLELPFIGGLFRCCLDGNLKHGHDSNKLSFGDKSATSWFGMADDSTRSVLDSSDKPSSVYLPMLRSESVGSLGSSIHLSDTKSSSGAFAIQYAMKSIHLDRVTDKNFLAELRNEIAILKRLDHPHIVRAIETFEHRDQIFIIMDLCSGGDLYSRDPYTEEQAARIISSILSAVAYMHAKNIVHRDLKYENVLFVNDSPYSEIKLIDFGLSKVYGDNTQIAEGVGTIYTMVSCYSRIKPHVMSC